MFFAFLFFDLILRIGLHVNIVVYCGHVVCVRLDMRYKCGMGLLPCHRVTCRACILATTEGQIVVENCEDLNKSKNTSSNDNNVESIRKQPTYAEIARRAVK